MPFRNPLPCDVRLRATWARQGALEALFDDMMTRVRVPKVVRLPIGWHDYDAGSLDSLSVGDLCHERP